MERLMEKWGGGEILRRAVRGMLPKNRLRDIRLMRLKVFEGEAHPYKKNIMRFAGNVKGPQPELPKVKIGELPQVQASLAEQHAAQGR